MHIYILVSRLGPMLLGGSTGLLPSAGEHSFQSVLRLTDSDEAPWLVNPHHRLSISLLRELSSSKHEQYFFL